MKSFALVSWLLVFGLLAAAYGSYHVWKSYQEDDFGSSSLPWSDPGATHYKSGLMQTPGGELADFTLVDSTGEPYHLRDSAGKVRAVSFFFVSCPSVCFQLNSTLAKIQADLNSKDIQFLSITCDPKNDTPSALANYATRFGADPKRWVFLTGEMPTLEDIGKSLMITVKPATHSERVMLLDRQGRLRGHFIVTEPDQIPKLKKAIADLIAEPYSPPPETTAAPPADATDQPAAAMPAATSAGGK